MFWKGKADDGAWKLAELLGWKEELEKIINTEWEKIEKKSEEGAGKVLSAATTASPSTTTASATAVSAMAVNTTVVSAAAASTTAASSAASTADDKASEKRLSDPENPGKANESWSLCTFSLYFC